MKFKLTNPYMRSDTRASLCVTEDLWIEQVMDVEFIPLSIKQIIKLNDSMALIHGPHDESGGYCLVAGEAINSVAGTNFDLEDFKQVLVRVCDGGILVLY